jgi:hypothetical protein
MGWGAGGSRQFWDAMATAELPRPPLVRAPTTPDSTPPTMGQHERAQSQRLQAHARSGELSTSSWTRRLDLYLAQYDHEGDARARDAGYGADAAGGVGGRTPLGHIDNNRMRCDDNPTPPSHFPEHPLSPPHSVTHSGVGFRVYS